MKILYRQSSACDDNSQMQQLNIINCLLKEIKHKSDYKITTLKSHYHTEYEIHMIFSGKQCYEIDGAVHEVNKNEFIIIPPKTKHRMTFASENLLKYSITFDCDNNMDEILYRGIINDTIKNSLSFISEEFRQKQPSSFTIIENRVFEVLILLLRIIGHKEKCIKTEMHLSDHRLDLAKKFIIDNIERNLSVTDVASYCHLSARQLTRNFLDTDGISPAKYINNERMKKIGEYIKNSDLSLRQISELFSYNNEYYFNTAFKNYYGMPPLAYRKMFR